MVVRAEIWVRFSCGATLALTNTPSGEVESSCPCEGVFLITPAVSIDGELWEDLPEVRCPGCGAILETREMDLLGTKPHKVKEYRLVPMLDSHLAKAPGQLLG